MRASPSACRDWLFAVDTAGLSALSGQTSAKAGWGAFHSGGTSTTRGRYVHVVSRSLNTQDLKPKSRDAQGYATGPLAP